MIGQKFPSHLAEDGELSFGLVSGSLSVFKAAMWSSMTAISALSLRILSSRIFSYSFSVRGFKGLHFEESQLVFSFGSLLWNFWDIYVVVPPSAEKKRMPGKIFLGPPVSRLVIRRGYVRAPGSTYELSLQSCQRHRQQPHLLGPCPWALDSVHLPKHARGDFWRLYSISLVPVHDVKQETYPYSSSREQTIGYRLLQQKEPAGLTS
jgi:hypothetical protein